MIQFNLLPSVKQEYINANRTKRMVVAIAITAGVFALSIFTLLFINVNFVQKNHISNLTNEIASNTEKLQEIEDVDKILTVQNQLNVLPSLHEQKPAAQRAQQYLQQVTPQQASVSEASIDFETGIFQVSGTADSLVTVNKFVDTLKFTKFTVGDSSEQESAFSEVVLKTFSINNDQATYQIEFKYDPVIFDNTNKVTLIVPNIITTRSQTQKPGSDLFQKSPEQTTQEEGATQ